MFISMIALFILVVQVVWFVVGWAFTISLYTIGAIGIVWVVLNLPKKVLAVANKIDSIL